MRAVLDQSARLAVAAIVITRGLELGTSLAVVKMTLTWYVTFEAQKRGILPKSRSPRETRTFATEV